MLRQALIIAAGQGTRLQPHATHPKPLVPIAGRPLLEWVLRGVEQAGCTDAVVVVGYRAEEVTGFLRTYAGQLRCRWVHNRRFEGQNGLSVLAAAPLLQERFLLLMCDHIVEPELLCWLQRQSLPAQGIALCVDFRLERILDLADATKAMVHEGKVRAIGKELQAYNAVDTGVFVAGSALLAALQAVVESQGDASLTDGVRRLAALGQVHALDIGEHFWQDVDTPAMLAHAERWLQRYGWKFERSRACSGTLGNSP